MKVFFELKYVLKWLYEKIIAKLIINVGCCIIGITNSCLLFHILFDIYIDRGIFGRSELHWYYLTGIVIILIPYANDIVLFARGPSHLDKWLRILKVFWFSFVC